MGLRIAGLAWWQLCRQHLMAAIGGHELCRAFSPRPPSRSFCRNEGRTRAAQRIQRDIAAFGRVADGPLDEACRLHSRVQVVPGRLVEKPDVALVAGTTPVVIDADLPAILDRLVLSLIIGTPEREGILGPDHEGRPFAAGLAEAFCSRSRSDDDMQTTCRRHADVDGAPVGLLFRGRTNGSDSVAPTLRYCTRQRWRLSSRIRKPSHD